MDTLGLSSRLRRIKDPNTIQIWDEVIKEYLTTISTNIGTSAILTEQDNEDDEENMNTVLLRLLYSRLFETNTDWPIYNSN
jgi:hypothetical protein